MKTTTTWYRVSEYSSKPEAIEVIRETEKCLITEDSFGVECKRLKENSWEKYFNNIEDAQARLVEVKAKRLRENAKIKKVAAVEELFDALIEARRLLIANAKEKMSEHLFEAHGILVDDPDIDDFMQTPVMLQIEAALTKAGV